jgi:ABC-type multidrug transport system fused ATPase/permease subunit
VTSSYSGVFQWLLRRYAKRHIWILLLVVVLTVVSNAMTVIQPMILAALLANIAGSATQEIPGNAALFDLNLLGARITAWISDSGNRNADQVLVLFGLLFFVQATSAAVLTYATECGSQWLQVRYSKLIQSDLITHLFNQDIKFFSNQKSGALISRVTRDASTSALGLSGLIRALLNCIVQIGFYAVYLFSTSIWLTFVTLVLLVTHFGLTGLMRRPIQRVVQQETDAAADLSTVLQESLLGIRVAKSFGVADFELSRLSKTLETLAASMFRKARTLQLEIPIRSVFDAVAILGLFAIAIQQMTAGLLSFEGLLLFTYVGRLLITPINHMGTNTLWIESIKASYGRISELMSTRSSIVDGAIVKNGFDQALAFKNVSFAYGEHVALRNINIEIKKGEFVALVGPSGSGKSTLTDLILRMHDPSTGEIRVDDLNLKDARLKEYLQTYGVVPQESILFHDTVRENIRYGREYVTESDIEKAAQIANAHDFIMQLPDQYDTVVGDRGMRLSGGERQRVAIARAVAHKPKVLIFDEATSSLDAASEQAVQSAIDSLVTKTTAIVIAHRLSTVTSADRIIVLNQGEVEAIGTSEKLLETSSTYRALHGSQVET